MNKGKLYGVSVGPGDPELMTLKAKRIVEGCPVVAAPVTPQDNTLALDIAAQAASLTDKTLLKLPFLMSRDKKRIAEQHKENADAIIAHLEEGRDVAMLNLGDVSVYSTFGYINDLVRAAGYESILIPGVPSFCAVACRLGEGLTEMRKPLVILPSGYEHLGQSLRQEGTLVLMKQGSQLGETKQLLAEAGLLEQARMVANCTLPNEQVFLDLGETSHNEGYFTTIVIKEKWQHGV